MSSTSPALIVTAILCSAAGGPRAAPPGQRASDPQGILCCSGDLNKEKEKLPRPRRESSPRIIALEQTRGGKRGAVECRTPAQTSAKPVSGPGDKGLKDSRITSALLTIRFLLSCCIWK